MASSATKKTTQPRKATKTTSKKSPVVKKVSTPKATKKVAVKSSHFTQNIIPEAKNVHVPHVKKEETDTSMFTTVLAIFIIAFMVLGGYVYSRQAHKTDVLSEDLTFPAPSYQPAMPSVPSNQKSISTSSSVSSTPELQMVLSNISDMLYVESDDILQSFNIVSDVVSAQAGNWDLYKHANAGDYALEFKNRSILFRPSEQKIINVTTGPITAQK